MQIKFHAKNFDRAVKAKAEAEAHRLSKTTGQRHVVTYRDDYNDYSVSGNYIVTAA